MPTTIAEQVQRLTANMAAQPSNELMGAFAREQGDLAEQSAYGGDPAG